MPSKKVIGELVSKKCLTYLLCIKKTTQIQGNSALLKHSNRIVQNHFNEVSILPWIHTAVKNRV